MKIKMRVTKKGRMKSYPDIVRSFQNSLVDEDESFYYVEFDETDKKLDRLFSTVGGWKATKIWIDGKEVDNGDIGKVIFCPFLQNCDGICKHSLGLELYRMLYGSPFAYKKIAERESLEGLKTWYEKNQELEKYEWNYELSLLRMIEDDMIKRKKERK